MAISAHDVHRAREAFIRELGSAGWIYSAAKHTWIHPATGSTISDYDLYKMANDGILQVPVPKPAGPSRPLFPGYSDESKLRMRLDIPGGEPFPWGYVSIVRGNQYVSLIIATNQRDTINVLQDDVHLFPSDTLIAKLRLLEP